MTQDEKKLIEEKDRRLSSHGAGDSLYNHAAQQVKTSVLGVAVLFDAGIFRGRAHRRLDEQLPCVDR